jgi:hypothetical protein
MLCVLVILDLFGVFSPCIIISGGCIYPIDTWIYPVTVICIGLFGYISVILWNSRNEELSRLTLSRLAKLMSLTVLAAMSLLISMGFAGVLLVSCSGHPPGSITSFLGGWIFPVSAFCVCFFMYLTIISWNATRKYGGADIKRLH